MRHTESFRWTVRRAVVVVAALLAWPVTGAAQLLTDTTQSVSSTTATVTGQATAIRATVFDLLGGATTTVLADTGTLQDTTDARDAWQITGSVPALLTGEVLEATTIGWPDQVASGASLGALALNVGGTTIGADFVVAEAMALLGTAGSGASYVDNLSINGAPIAVSGDPNQVFYISGGRVVINEQKSSPGGIVVNALHVIVDGVADVVIGTANAGIQ